MGKRDNLRPTDTPGVFLNTLGTLVDRNGVALAFKDLKRKDDARFKEVLGGPVETPADLLRAIAMDPRFPMHQRIDAANKAAPYFSAKRVAVSQAPGSKTPEQQAADIRAALGLIEDSVGGG